MSGPIVRSGPSEKFTNNWEKVFAGKAAATSSQTPAAKKKSAKPAKTAKKPTVAKTAKKKKA